MTHSRIANIWLMNAARPLLLAGFVATLVSACTTDRVSRGYIPDMELVNAIEPGIDTRNSVVGTLGSPTVASRFQQDTWYYISRPSKRRAWFREQPISQMIFEVKFDDSGTVNNVRRYNLADARNVSIRGGKTPNRGKEVGFFEQLFSNIGRFSGAGGPR